MPKTKNRGGLASSLTKSGTISGAKFTPVDEQVHDLLRVVHEKFGYWEEACRSLGISPDTLWQLRDGGTRFVSDGTVLRLLGAKSMPPVWERRVWLTKGEWMKSGEWGRGKGPNYIVGDYKRCTGPKHKEGGELVLLSNFLYHKTGKRAGRPFARCKDCNKWERLKNYRGIQGRISVSRVRWIFVELENRIGRREVVRRAGLSWNIWRRLQKQRYLQKWTVYRAITLLREVREEQGA